jgi:hypothetical protein
MGSRGVDVLSQLRLLLPRTVLRIVFLNDVVIDEIKIADPDDPIIDVLDFVDERLDVRFDVSEDGLDRGL